MSIRFATPPFDERAFGSVDVTALPDDEQEFSSIPPDDAPADGSAATPGLPLESAAVPDVEPPDEEVLHGEETVDASVAPMHTSLAGLHLIEGFEGFSPVPYRDPVGVWTIGYGTTSADVSPLPRHLTRAEAESLLRSKLASKYEPAVRALGVPLNQNQFDALVSFVYNLGTGVLGPSHTIGKLLRERNYHGAADSLLLYVHAGGVVLPGLLRRREAERAVFLEHPAPAPDPHHLLWFPDETWTFGHRRVPDRGTVVEAYRLLAARDKAESAWAQLRDDLTLLRKRVWTVAHFVNPPSWAWNHEGYRWQAYLALSREEAF